MVLHCHIFVEACMSICKLSVAMKAQRYSQSVFLNYSFVDHAYYYNLEKIEM